MFEPTFEGRAVTARLATCKKMVKGTAGIEPATAGSAILCSTAELSTRWLGHARGLRHHPEARTPPNHRIEKQKGEPTPRGFEPLRTKSTHLAGERLNHSAKASWGVGPATWTPQQKSYARDSQPSTSCCDKKAAKNGEN